MPLPQGQSHKLAPKWLSPFMIDQVISPVAYCVDLPPKYIWLHLIFHTLYLKPYVGMVPNVEPPVITGDNDAKSEEDIY